MDIPSRFIIYESRHWVVNHRMDSALPGYVMLSAKQMTNSLAALSAQALAELGPLQAKIQHAIETLLHPRRLYISRYGHETGYSIHFHFIPIYAWIETLFWQDKRYRSLQAFGSCDNATPQTDGAELTLFVWREFCERPDPPAVQGPSVDETISVLREVLADSGLC
ncbi:HIT family protein [Pseudomonas sp. SLFW]|uniref:HIT family protein n=1 Tax=Pseudomonas sp. SLFW TaxID=2683259 RepID=UPI0014124194|nr:HIT family protein [Pseudomonas sp. SLFW]NBB11214.1 HIT family protein [Pseudomonas sp. SLFW]